MFSIATVELSTRMPTARAKPPSVIVLMVWPSAEKIAIELRIDSGIDTMTMRVDRHEPRKIRIISAVSPAAITPSRSTPAMACFTNTDWSNRRFISMPGGAALRISGMIARTASTTVERRGVAVLDDRQENRTPAIGMHDVLLYRPAVADMSDIAQVDGCAADLTDRDVVERFDRLRHGVDADDELRIADLGVAGWQCQALGIDRVDDVVRGKTVGTQRIRVEIDHDLPILAAVRGRQGDAIYRRQRLAQAIDAIVVKLLLVHPV